MSAKLRDLLIKHEGMRLKPYVDTVGKITLGCGRNLTDVGISELEANLMLKNDMDRTEKDVIEAFPWFTNLAAARQDVLLNMAFNTGIEKLKGFKNMLEALKLQNYEKAALEMENSHWASQVGQRAKDLAIMMRTGTYLGVL